MVRSRSRLTAALILGSPLLLGAVIEQLDLRQMVEKTEGAVVGTIVESWTSWHPLAGSPHEFTHLRIRGENLYTGQPPEVVVSFLGGEEQWCAEAPTKAETRVGNRVLAFHKWSPALGGVGMNCIYAAYGGLYRVEKGPRGEVVIGRGEGYAVDRSVRLADLRERIASLRAESSPRAPAAQ